MTSTADPSRRSSLAAAGAIGLAALLAYHGSFHVPLLMDDDRAITQNATIRHLSDWKAVLSPPPASGPSGRPLLNLSYALNYAVGGDNVVGYHVVNLVLHALAGCVLFGVVRRTLKRWSATSGRAGSGTVALFAALIWTVHPLQSEAVIYISERAEVMMGVFYLLTLYCFIRSASPSSPTSSDGLVAEASRAFGLGPRSGPETPGAFRYASIRMRWDWISIACCFLGMATKEVMVTAPFVVFVYDAIFIAGSASAAWRLRWRYYAALASTWLLLAWLMTHAKHSIGYQQHIGVWHYLLTECGAIVRYLGLALWGSPLVFDYGPQFVTHPLQALPCAGLLLALISGAIVLLKRAPAWGFLAIWWFVLLAPTSSVVPIALQPIAENRVYLPLAAVVVLAALAGQRWLGRAFRWVAGAFVAAALAATMARTAVYRDRISLWTDTVNKRPENARAHDSLGYALVHAGRAAEATAQYRLAAQLAPDDPLIRYDLGKSLHDGAERVQTLVNFGLNDLQAGNLAGAGSHFTAALELDPANAEAHYRLGNLAAMAGRFPEAIAQWQAALETRPNDAEANNNLGLAYEQIGNNSEAIRRYQEALRINPGYDRARANLSDLQSRQK